MNFVRTKAYSGTLSRLKSPKVVLSRLKLPLVTQCLKNFGQTQIAPEEGYWTYSCHVRVNSTPTL